MVLLEIKTKVISFFSTLLHCSTSRSSYASYSFLCVYFSSLIFPLISPTETQENARWLHGFVLFLLQKCIRRNLYFFFILRPAICCVSKGKRKDSRSWNFILRERLTDAPFPALKTYCGLQPFAYLGQTLKHSKIYDKWNLLVCKGKGHTKP